MPTDEALSVATRPTLEITDLAVSFDAPRDRAKVSERVQAVDGVSLTIHPRQTLALVGESGCGKSVTALSCLRLLPSPPARIDRGSIKLDGRELLSLSKKQMRAVRGGEIAMIFQEPMASLNPVYTVGEQILEAIYRHQKVRGHDATDLAVQAMEDVGIPRPEQGLRAYPHEYSGGMQQRVMIAMALACQPRVLLADEPTTALDVTIQSQILQLLSDLQRSRGMAMMLITHDLGVVAETADVVCVMYGGRVVEYATVYEIFEKPLHPYTRALLRCVPHLGERKQRLTTILDIVTNPHEFATLKGPSGEGIPWWPQTDPSLAAGCVLREIEPGHYVGCRPTGDQPATGVRPDIAFRRDHVLSPV